MKDKNVRHPLETRLQAISDLLEHLVAIEMYRGGATQPEIAASLSMSIGKVNKLVKGVKPPKTNAEN
jgi:hypothetical protein